MTQCFEVVESRGVRFAGELRIEPYEGERLVESHSNDASRELMYFGKARS